MSISVTYVAMPKSKIQKSRYLENETFFFFSDNKIYWLLIKGYYMVNSFVADVTFKRFYIAN